MDVHASPAELPALKELLGAFQGRFRRPEGAPAVERSLTGLLTELPTKNCDTMAHAVPGTSEQPRQEFLTTMPWDAEDLHRQRVSKMIVEATLGDGVLVLDDPGLAPQGKASGGWPASMRARWARWAPVRARSLGATPIPRRRGRWRGACPCPRTGPRMPTVGARPASRPRPKKQHDGTRSGQNRWACLPRQPWTWSRPLCNCRAEPPPQAGR